MSKDNVDILRCALLRIAEITVPERGTYRYPPTARCHEIATEALDNYMSRDNPEPHAVGEPPNPLEYYRRLQMVEVELERWKAMVGVGTKEDAETIIALRARVVALSDIAMQTKQEKDKIEDVLRVSQELVASNRDKRLAIEAERDAAWRGLESAVESLEESGKRVEILEATLWDTRHGGDSEGPCWCMYVQLMHPQDDPQDSVKIINGHTQECWQAQRVMTERTKKEYGIPRP
jgi:hypothetical protein